MRMVSHLLPAPIKGLDTRSNLIYADPEYALQTENWIPGINLVSSRRGYRIHKISSDFLTPFQSLIPFTAPGGASDFLFAGSDTGLFKVPMVGGSFQKVVDGGNGDGWSGAVQSTGVRTRMRLVDGGSKDIIYDSADDSVIDTEFRLSGGASWITLHHGHFFLGLQNSLDFYYLPAGVVQPHREGGKKSLTNDYVRFPLGQYMRKGGTLIGAASWSRDTGSGMHDYAVFTSSQGESCIYEGSNPGDATAWRLVGIFEHGKPLGARNRCFQKIGGDLYISTTDGVQSFTSLINEASEQLGFAEMTNRIANRISEVMARASGFGWGLQLHSSEQLLYFNIPFGFKSEQYVFNILTNAVTHFTGINVYCLAEIGDKLYATGRTPLSVGSDQEAYPIYELNNGGTDNGNAIPLKLRHSFSGFGDSTRIKQITHVQIHIEAGSDPDLRVALLTDLENERQLHTQSPPSPTKDASVWNKAKWGPRSAAVPNPGVWGGSRRVYNKYVGLRKFAKFGSLSIETSSRGTPMILHGSTVYYLPSSKTTPRNLR